MALKSAPFTGSVLHRARLKNCDGSGGEKPRIGFTIRAKGVRCGKKIRFEMRLYVFREREKIMYEDKILICKDCGAQFVFTAGEQEFYAEKGFENEPKRCKACRIAKRGDRAGEREMFTAICDGCGREVRVPFEPHDGRPVYCSECYAKMREQQGY